MRRRMRIAICNRDAERATLLNVLLVCIHVQQLLDLSPLGRNFGLLRELLEKMKNHVLHRDRQNAKQNEVLGVIVEGNEGLQHIPRTIHKLHHIDFAEQVVVGVTKVQHLQTGVNE